MDPINLIIGLNIIATFGANVGGAKKGVRSSLIASKEKPKTYLQTLPLILSAFTLVSLIIAVFQIGTFNYQNFSENIRLVGLVIYLIFSWIQIWSYKTLGENYSQEIVIFKNHNLITKGPFKFIRHPQYLSQILADLGGGIATLSFVLIIFLIIEIPFLIMRAKLEEKLLEKNFKETFQSYKKKTGFIIPFVG